MVNPKLYAVSDNLQTHNVELIIEEFAEDLKNMSGKCMDIGCGPGNSTKDLLLPALHPNSTVIGTDIDKSMIEYANRNYNDRKRLKFDVLDIQAKYLPKKYIFTLDHIFSFHALHWCTDIEQAFRNIHLMLRPGGSMLTLIIASHDVANTFKTLAEDIRFAPYLKDLKHTYPFNNVPCPQKQIKTLLQNIGFKIRHCSLREAISMNQDKFIDSMISMCSSLDKMTADRKEEFKTSFRRDFISRKIMYTPRNNDKEQTCVLDIYSMLIIYAVKDRKTY